MLDFVEYRASLDVHAAQNFIEKGRNCGRLRHVETGSNVISNITTLKNVGSQGISPLCRSHPAHYK